MDSYDIPWYNVKPIENHPIEGISTLIEWDPQRKSLGDTLEFARKLKFLADSIPSDDKQKCSTGYCTYCEGKEYLAYQPDGTAASITIDIAPGSYDVETFNTIDSSSQKSTLGTWAGGKKTFEKPQHAAEDWVIYLSAI